MRGFVVELLRQRRAGAHAYPQGVKISKRHPRRRSLITVLVLLTEALPLWLRGYRL